MTASALPGPDINDPENSFASPRALVESEELTRGMKAYALDQWELVALRFSDVRLLDEIAQARELLATRYDGQLRDPRNIQGFEQIDRQQRGRSGGPRRPQS